MLYPLYMMSLVTYFAKYFFVIGFDFKNFHNFCNHVCKGVSFIASYFLSNIFEGFQSQFFYKVSVIYLC